MSEDNEKIVSGTSKASGPKVPDPKPAAAAPVKVVPPAKRYSGAQLIPVSREVFGEPDWLVKTALKHAGLAVDKHHTLGDVQAAIDKLKARKVS